MEKNEFSVNARGGTELMLEALHARLDPDLVKEFQIIPTRARQLDPNRKRVLWVHDPPTRQETGHLEEPARRAEFDGIVFVSHYQAMWYHLGHGIPYSDMTVIQNAIEPFGSYRSRKSDRIRLIYHSAPDRGLEILVPVFEHLAERHHDIELDIFSSFKLYGWPHHDERFLPLFDRCMKHPRIRYHGARPNAEVRRVLSECDIFTYPNILTEMCCLAAVESMSAGCLTVCPAYGALPETCANFARLYPFTENKQEHAYRFAAVLDDAIHTVRQRKPEDERLRARQVEYFNHVYSWERRIPEWTEYLHGLRK